MKVCLILTLLANRQKDEPLTTHSHTGCQSLGVSQGEQSEQTVQSAERRIVRGAHKALIKPDEKGGEVAEGKHETLLLPCVNPYLCTVFVG